jgi:hypothetical protein
MLIEEIKINLFHDSSAKERKIERYNLNQKNIVECNHLLYQNSILMRIY